MIERERKKQLRFVVFTVTNSWIISNTNGVLMWSAANAFSVNYSHTFVLHAGIILTRTTRLAQLTLQTVKCRRGVVPVNTANYAWLWFC